MDEKKKQIVMICVLGALVVGAGSYYFLIRDSGSTRKANQSRGLAERKVRESTAKVDTRKRKNRSRGSKAPTIVKAGRKERKASTRQQAKRKSRRGTAKKIKKKKMSPAA